MKKRSLFLIVILIVSFALSGCNGNNKITDNINNIDFWGTYSTEKVLQQQNLVTNIKTLAEINLDVAKGEYESYQIIMSAKNDITEYDVTVNDLTLQGDVTKKIPISNISVYNQKYINVVEVYEGNGMPEGMYPDALLPFATAKKYGENKIASGKNQGIYFTFYIPLTQTVGTYSGTFEIKIGSGVKNVPVNITVWDISVSEVPHAKNIYLTDWNYQNGELDSSQDMMNKYTDALIEYRLAPGNLVHDNAHTDADIAAYADLAYSYLSNSKCSNISIPFKNIQESGDWSIDKTIFEKYLHAFAQKSFKENFNMIEKCISYIGIIDEPLVVNTVERTKKVITKYKAALVKVAEEIKAMATITSPIKGDVVNSIRNLKNIVTCEKNSELEDYVSTWCPKFSHFNTSEERNEYSEQSEKWWYGCNGPKAPYPTFHMEDTLISPRAMGWMQAQYDITGNLYWATNVYAKFDGQEYMPLEDYYSTASRFPYINGDGFLFYPGKQYGLDKPVASLRLQTIRDGLEDYELIYALKQQYQELSDSSIKFNADSIINDLSEEIYTGAQVYSNSAIFAEARRNLFDVIKLADNGVAITKKSDNNAGNVQFKVFAKMGVEIAIDDELESGTAVVGGKTITVNKELTRQTNNIKISTTVGGRSLAYTSRLGGSFASYNAEALKDSFAKEDCSVKTSVVSGNTVSTDINVNLLKLSISKSGYEIPQSVRFTFDKFKNINSSTKKVVFNIYNGSAEELDFAITAKFSNLALYKTLSTVKLKNGMNTIILQNLNSYNWESLGFIEFGSMYFGNDVLQPARDNIFLKDMLVFNA